MKFNNKKLKIMKKVFLILLSILSMFWLVQCENGSSNGVLNAQVGGIIGANSAYHVTSWGSGSGSSSKKTKVVAESPQKATTSTAVLVSESSQEYQRAVDFVKPPQIVATMMALKRGLSVAYVLYEDGRVDVLYNSRLALEKDLPFTKAQARILLQAKLDGKACNY